MTKELPFSNTNIHMARQGDSFILWDTDTDTFAFGSTYEEALKRLSENIKYD